MIASSRPSGTLTAAQYSVASGDVVVRRLALTILFIQAAGSLAAWSTDVMLHGDGSYFVYVLSTGEPWILKWHGIAARATVYITTVLPTEVGASLLRLSPMEISHLNGFIFYFVPTLQFALAYKLVWRSHPQYLMFPASQYAFSTAMGFGFPSEILLAPGFMWIALFMILKNRVLSILFVLSFAALVFSHELALPAALVTAYLAFKQTQDADHKSNGMHWRTRSILAIIFGVFAIFMYVRLNGGGAGSDQNAIYVIDPRRIGNNPTLWVVCAMIGATIAALRIFPSLARGSLPAVVLILGAFAFPLILRLTLPDISFEQGRYDSARSIIGAVMLILALTFAVAIRRNPEHKALPVHGVSGILLVVSVALAVSVGSSIAFLYDWSIALRGLERVIAPVSSDGKPEFVAYEKARSLMLPEERTMNDRMGYLWVLPFRSLVLADGGTPARISYIQADYTGYCAKAGEIDPERSVIPPQALIEMQHFSCSLVPPPPIDTMSRRFFRSLSKLGRWFWGDLAPAR